MQTSLEHFKSISCIGHAAVLKNGVPLPQTQKKVHLLSGGRDWQSPIDTAKAQAILAPKLVVGITELQRSQRCPPEPKGIFPPLSRPISSKPFRAVGFEGARSACHAFILEKLVHDAFGHAHLLLHDAA